MATEMNKKQLLYHIETSRGELENTLADIPHEKMLEPNVIDHWSIKDILCHIAIWEKRMANWLRISQLGKEPKMLPDGMTWDDLDEWNHQTYEENKDRELDEALALHHKCFAEAFEMIVSISEEDMLDPDKYPWRKGRPLWRIIEANTWEHYDEHKTQIQSWFDNQS